MTWSEKMSYTGKRQEYTFFHFKSRLNKILAKTSLVFFRKEGGLRGCDFASGEDFVDAGGDEGEEGF